MMGSRRGMLFDSPAEVTDLNVGEGASGLQAKGCKTKKSKSGKEFADLLAEMKKKNFEMIKGMFYDVGAKL